MNQQNQKPPQPNPQPVPDPNHAPVKRPDQMPTSMPETPAKNRQPQEPLKKAEIEKTKREDQNSQSAS